MTIPTDPFPVSEFDDWAETYDNSVSIDQFPFNGYPDVLVGLVVLVIAVVQMQEQVGVWQALAFIAALVAGRDHDLLLLADVDHHRLLAHPHLGTG
jgi:hypothetical protein